MTSLIAHTAAVLGLGAAMTGADLRYAVRYDPGVMERVAANRRIPAVSCMIAHPTLPIGAWVWIEGAQTGIRKHCQVIDTSQDWDRARHIRTKLIELGYQNRDICPLGWGGARRECPVLVR